MNFCQKITKNRCIHARRCNKESRVKKTKKNHSNPKATIKENCRYVQCQTSLIRQSDERLRLLIQQKQGVISEIRAKLNTLQLKNDYFIEQNRHLHAQIEYYRDQFNNIFSNHQNQHLIQVKKRAKELKQHSELLLKVKKLQNLLYELSKQKQSLETELRAQRQLNSTNSKRLALLSEKYQTGSGTNHRLQKEKEVYQEQLALMNKQLRALQERHDLLKKQYNSDCQLHKKKAKRTAEQAEKQRIEIVQNKNKMQKEKELKDLQIASLLKKEKWYAQTLQEHQAQIKANAVLIEELSRKNKQSQDDLAHAKVVISKQIELKDNQSLIQKSLLDKKTVINSVFNHHSQSISKQKYYHESNHEKDSKLDDKKTAWKEQRHQFERGKENKQINDFKQEISRLNQRIRFLQSQQRVNIQETILNMGASEAFKRLLQQKNTEIKRHIKEKEEIYKLVVPLQPLY